MFTGWKLSKDSQDMLMLKFPPKFPDVFAHHITYMFGKNSEVPNDSDDIKVVGVCETDTIQCLIIKIDGTTVRPDSGTYHITWSIDKSKGAKPVDSNNAIKTNGFQSVADTPIKCIAKRF